MGEKRAGFVSRRRDEIVDVLLATAVLAYTIPHMLLRPHAWFPVSLWLSVPATVVAALTLLVRRRTAWPSLAASVVCAAFTGQGVALAAAAYSMAAAKTVRAWRATAGGLAAVYLLADYLAPESPRMAFLSAFHAVAFVYLPAMIGNWERAYRAMVDDLRESMWLREEHAASRERRRIAGELHDTVTHAVTVMVLNAGIIQDNDDLGEIRKLAKNVEDKGVRALAELRELLTVLRRADMPASAAGLEAIPPLVAEGNVTGLRVALHLDVPPGLLNRQAEHACFRVVQEGLNNVRKHAPGARVQVDCEACGDVVNVSVVNGPGGEGHDPSPAEHPVRSGYGLVGLKERVNLVGGWIMSGPTPEGGFALTARVPCHPPDASPRPPAVSGR
ncbi:sensor histidine kinase [Planotetraspora kaengkrachanensis]|uniref:histidine kinase n=1 Tax=Planotetraspora kaengkrachanensis TaxID=575193 RepID=A0A8J3PUU7_9ACTN|nr:histidine kinase [Planotetraspora kaengkrachanensis]GIG81482.1 two-component sensor histidine kinase [Planotetraspora kaengkrachanensis]